MITEIIEKASLHNIDVSSGRFIPSIPWIETDNKPIGIFAAITILEDRLLKLANLLAYMFLKRLQS